MTNAEPKTAIALAASMAEEAHMGQIDRDGKPHYEHCRRVAERMHGVGAFAPVVVAYLHDTLEDTTLVYGEIEAKFGTEIADAVLAMTHLPQETYEQFIERCGCNPVARIVKIADIRDNLGRKDSKMFRKHDVYMWALEYLQHGIK